MADLTNAAPGQAQPAPTPDGQPAPRVVSDQDKALAKEWLKRIDAALVDRKDDEKEFKGNRKWLRGIDPETGKKLRTNLHFANLAAMRPQVYAKDPEYACELTKAVPEQEVEVWRNFGATSEAVLKQKLVKEAALKRRAKRILTSAYATGLGWWKLCWQENRQTDPMIVNQIKDTQDNLARLQTQRDQLHEAQGAGDIDLKVAQLQQTLDGLQAQAEVKVARGLTVDFTLPEDVIVLDQSVRELVDYERADALAHRVWMTRDQYRLRFGYDPTKGKTFREAGQSATNTTAGLTTAEGLKDKTRDLLCVWEVWEQATNRVFTVCDGEEGFCRQPYSPDWTGERWYPFFLLTFNDAEGYMPLSDVGLTIEVIKEYNATRDDFERDRKNALPVNVVRKGGSLTPGDVEKIANRQGGDVIVVEGQMGKPLSDDIWSGQLGNIRPENYDTNPARTDMEMLVSIGDAQRGAIMKAKTATEAEIMNQGLRGRSAERVDVIEDLLTEVGKYALEICLRKLTPEEVMTIAGTDAQWPQLRAEDVFRMVSLGVRGGSTGKPDMLQQQDRWTKLLPVIQDAMGKVGELRAQGQEEAAQAVIALVKETLRRFDERIDIEQFMPAPKKGEQPGGQQITPHMVQQAQDMIQALQQQVAELNDELKDKQADRALELQKAQIAADSAEEVERTKAAAVIESARIGALGKALQPLPQEPAGVMSIVDGLEQQDMRQDALENDEGGPLMSPASAPPMPPTMPSLDPDQMPPMGGQGMP